MFVSINEYRKSINENINSNLLLLKNAILEYLDENTDITFDVWLFEDLEDNYNIDLEYFENNYNLIGEYLKQFGISITSYDDESVEFRLKKWNVNNEAVINNGSSDQKIKLLQGDIGRDQAIEIANSLGFAFDISSKYHSHYVWTENINSSVISSIEYRLYKVSDIRWKISSRITYALINSENVSEVNTISDVCWFNI